MDIGEREVETWTVVVDADLGALQRELRFASSLGRQFSNSLSSAFQGVAIKGKSLSDVFKGLALDLSRIVVRAAFRPLERGFGNALNGLLSGGGLAARSTAGATPALPIPFAKGGVIANPLGFPLGPGRSGIAGERGAEAILPLGRSSDGRLGVVSNGTGTTSVTVNISTPDVESFKRSQTQVAAMLARAVSAGQRNL